MKKYTLTLRSLITLSSIMCICIPALCAFGLGDDNDESPPPQPVVPMHTPLPQFLVATDEHDELDASVLTDVDPFEDVPFLVEDDSDVMESNEPEAAGTAQNQTVDLASIPSTLRRSNANYDLNIYKRNK